MILKFLYKLNLHYKMILNLEIKEFTEKRKKRKNCIYFSSHINLSTNLKRHFFYVTFREMQENRASVLGTYEQFCVRTCARARARVCVCVCEREREREREWRNSFIQQQIWLNAVIYWMHRCKLKLIG